MAKRLRFFKCLAGFAIVTGSLIATAARADDGANGQNGNGAGASTIANQSRLLGGNGSDGTNGGSGGMGGVGALVTGGGHNTNISTISGGAGGDALFFSDFFGGPGGAGGDGVSFAASSATFTNTGVVTAGAGGAGAYTVFCCPGSGGAGGDGVSFAASGATFTNTGVVTAGAGGAGGEGAFVAGILGIAGAGVSFAGGGATFTNSGMVSGGGGADRGGQGGYGALFTGSGATFANSGAIIGGHAGSEGFTRFVGFGGLGGDGALFARGGATFTNSGTVAGGRGGDAPIASAIGAFGGTGGVGVTFAGNSTFTNNGVVTGGGGGEGTAGLFGGIGFSGAGGPAVVGDGLTIINGGLISGGLSSDGVTRADAIDFTGGANVLELRAGSTILGNVVGAGADLLRLGGSGNSAFDASALGTQYQGFGSVEKSGASAWTLTGSTSVSAPWTINQGVLIMNGASIANASLTTVNAGGTLAGAGGVGNLLVTSGGTVAPGLLTGPGIITVAGKLAFQPATTYSVPLGGALGSRADVSGVALLNGALVTTLAPGESLTKTNDILHADGGLDNTRFVSFDGPPNFNASLSYDAKDVFLDLTAVLGAGAGLASNQQSVANALNGYFNADGSLPGNLAKLYGLTGAALPNALASASGEAATGAQESAFQSTDLFIEAMLDPFAIGRSQSVNSVIATGPGADLPTHKDAPPTFDSRWTSWAEGFGGDARIDGDPAGAGSHDLSTNAAGVSAGVDYHLARDMLVGVALGGARTGWGLSQGFGGGDGDVFDLGVYGSRQFGAAYVSGALAFSNEWLTTSRGGSFGEPLSADFVSQTYGGRIEGGYRLTTQAGGLTPYGALEAMDFDVRPYHEQDCCDSGFGLAYAGHTASDIRSEFGARFDAVDTVQSGAVLTLRARAAWMHAWVSDPTVTAAFETLPGSSFKVVGAIPAKNAALLSESAELRLAGGVQIGARFDSELASQAHAYTGTLFAKVMF